MNCQICSQRDTKLFFSSFSPSSGDLSLFVPVDMVKTDQGSPDEVNGKMRDSGG